MSIRFTCSQCGKPISVSDDWAGRRAKCRDCGQVISLPNATDDTPSPPAETRLDYSPTPGPRPQTIALLIVGGVAATFILGIVALLLTRATSRAPSSVSIAVQLPSPLTQSRLESHPVFPQRPEPVRAAGNIDVYPMTIGGHGPGLPMQVRLYLPAGRHTEHSLPCVFIAPAGTHLLHGSKLDDGDNPEHLPYARAGFAVLAYELSGDFPDSHNPHLRVKDLATPVREFMDADGGLANARSAIQLVLSTVPEVDPARFYAAGHSSAATMTLNLVAADHRFRAVAAYAPACDVEARWWNDLGTINQLVPGSAAFAARVSPIKHVKDIACPMLLFHADDDTNVSTRDEELYVAALQAAGKQVQFTKVPTGGHYQSMIQQGIPDGIQFFIANGAEPLLPTR